MSAEFHEVRKKPQQELKMATGGNGGKIQKYLYDKNQLVLIS